MPVQFYVSLKSIGEEVFQYDTFDEAMEGVRRLCESCVKHTSDDKVDREVCFIVESKDPNASPE